MNVATVAPVTSDIEYAPVSTPARSGARARTSAGTTTCDSAIAAPASSVPRYSGAIPPIPRTPVPTAVAIAATTSKRSTGIAARDPRPELRERAQAEQRPGRQQARRRGRQPELGPDVRQQRRQAPEQRPQIEAGQDDRDR